MAEYKSNLTRMWQYLNRSVKEFLADTGKEISKREFADDAAALAAGLKIGELYSTPAGDVKVIK